MKVFVAGATGVLGRRVVPLLAAAGHTVTGVARAAIAADDAATGVAEAIGAGTPLMTGALMLRLSANTRFYLRSQRVTNRRFKEATGWAPRYPDAGTGWRVMTAGT